MKANASRHLALSAVLAAVAALAPAQTPAIPQIPYGAYLWIDGAFDLTEAARNRLRELGITGIDAEGPTGVVRAGESGMPFYVDHAVPKGFLHLRKIEFEDARARWRSDPVAANLRRPVCLRDPAALARATSDLRATLEACAPFSPAFLSLTDEPSTTRGVSPIDWCRDSFCAAAFPRFLAERWGSPALAREVWGARWPKDGAPAPVDTDEVRRALIHGLGSPATLVQWNDTRAFEDAGFAGALAALASEARRARPGLRIALLGASMPSAFGGFDWEEIGPRFDVIEPYDWGATRDLARSTAPRADLFQTITPGSGSVLAISHQIWRGFLRGDRGVILFDATDWTGSSSRPEVSSRPESRPALADLAPLLLRLEGESLAAWRRAVPLRPQVAILHSMPSTRLHWLLDTRYDGASWFNRLTSYENEQSSEALNREAWAAMLSDLGLSYRFVTPRELREVALAPDAPLALVLPRAIAMSDAEVAAVAKFAESRLVIADCQLALFTSRLQVRAKPALDDVFGISRAPVRGIDDLVAQEPDSRSAGTIVAAERGITATGASPMQSSGAAPVFFMHGQRSARTVYLNARIGSYVRTRIAHPEAAEKLRAALRSVFLAADVRPRFEATAAPWPGPVAVHAKKDGDDVLIGVELAATTGMRPIDWTRPVVNARPLVRVTLPGTYRVTDLLRGSDLGLRNAIEVEISAAEPALFRLRP